MNDILQKNAFQADVAHSVGNMRLNKICSRFQGTFELFGITRAF